MEVESIPLNLETIRLLVDAGLFILIWIVQLVIYPGFCYYSETDIKLWHALYTKRIAWIVMPLMLSQLFFYGIASFIDPSADKLVSALLVIILWLVTFMVAVPLHRDIELKDNTIDHRRKLVRMNWSRTLLWTLILMISILNYGK